MNRVVYTTQTPYVSPSQNVHLSPYPNGKTFCDTCEEVHSYCECDEFAYLGTHSVHKAHNHPHIMVR